MSVFFLLEHSHFQPSFTYVLYKIREILIPHFPTIPSLTWYPLIYVRTRHRFAWIASPIKMMPVSTCRKTPTDSWRNLTPLIPSWYHHFHSPNTTRVLTEIHTTFIQLFRRNSAVGNGERTPYCGYYVIRHSMVLSTVHGSSPQFNKTIYISKTL